MARFNLGELEELILLTIAVIPDPAYGVNISVELERQSCRGIDFSTVHTTLKRVEQNGFLRSETGGATAEHGGRRKRLFNITASGFRRQAHSHPYTIGLLLNLCF